MLIQRRHLSSSIVKVISAAAGDRSTSTVLVVTPPAVTEFSQITQPWQCVCK